MRPVTYLLALALVGIMLELAFTSDAGADTHPILTPELRAQVLAQSGYLPAPTCLRRKPCPS